MAPVSNLEEFLFRFTALWACVCSGVDHLFIIGQAVSQKSLSALPPFFCQKCEIYTDWMSFRVRFLKKIETHASASDERIIILFQFYSNPTE